MVDSIRPADRKITQRASVQGRILFSSLHAAGYYQYHGGEVITKNRRALEK